MKLLRYGAPGEERPGLLDPRGTLRDLSALIDDVGPDVLSPPALRALGTIDPATLPPVDTPSRLGTPIAGISKLVAVGLNYADHARESTMTLPGEPVLFLKAPSCISGPNDPIVIPKGATKVDWEVELGVVIGSRAKEVCERVALDHVAGYVIVHDVSEREYQLERGGQWDKGKGFDTFGPIGPWLVTSDEMPDPQSLNLWLDVNGERRQTGSTASMIFGVATLISYISHCFTLLPGDVIATGTPPGVGLGMKPPSYLKPGDTVRLSVDGLGEQCQRVVTADARRESESR